MGIPQILPPDFSLDELIAGVDQYGGGGGLTDVDIELAMDINTAVFGPDFDVKKTLASTDGELPDFDEIRRILIESVHALWWEGSKIKPK